MKTGLLLSGGMDSLCLAWWKRPEVAITVDYGQLPAEAEIVAAAALCQRLGIEHHVLRADCRALGSGDLAGVEISQYAPASDWWPYRNQLILTLAAMKAVSLGLTRLWIGTVRSDGTHRDGTAAFVNTFSDLLNLQEGNLTVEAPAIDMSTSDLVRTCGVPPEVLAWAHSCHKANVACGACRGCNKYFEILHESYDGMDRPR